MLTKKKITNNLFGVNPLFWPNLTILKRKVQKRMCYSTPANIGALLPVADYSNIEPNNRVNLIIKPSLRQVTAIPRHGAH